MKKLKGQKEFYTIDSKGNIRKVNAFSLKELNQWIKDFNSVDKNYQVKRYIKKSKK